MLLVPPKAPASPEGPTTGGDETPVRGAAGVATCESAGAGPCAQLRSPTGSTAAVEAPDADKTKSFLDYINPNSLTVLKGCKAEPSLAAATPDTRYQFERLGYFCVDPDSSTDTPVFNRTVSLKDAWAKREKGVSQR